MAAMSELLVEVLYLIVDQVEDSTTKRNLCLVSMLLCEITQPVLYQNFSPAFDYSTGPNSYLHYYNFGSPSRLHAFIRTILARPDLAACLQSLVLKGGAGEDDVRGNAEKVPVESGKGHAFDPITDSDLLKKFEEAIEAAQLFHDEGWEQELQGSGNTVDLQGSVYTVEILLSLIVALSPNLQEIFLAKISLLSGRAILKIASTEPTPHRPGGRRITKIHVGSLNMPTGPLYITQLTPFLSLPNISDLSGHEVFAFFRDHEALDRLPTHPFSNIKITSFRSCMDRMKFVLPHTSTPYCSGTISSHHRLPHDLE